MDVESVFHGRPSELRREHRTSSFSMVRRLVREAGLYVGGSAGANLVAALRVAARGRLHGHVITVMCDSWDRYRAKPWMQNWDRT